MSLLLLFNQEAAPTGYTISVTAGAYTITGYDATLTYTQVRTLNADSGTYTITGYDVTLVRGPRLLIVDTGAYVLVGNDASLTYSGSVGPATGMGLEFIPVFMPV